nr:MAG TPA: hypothetical protein [Caudoviricetes sp.]
MVSLCVPLCVPLCVSIWDANGIIEYALDCLLPLLEKSILPACFSTFLAR